MRPAETLRAALSPFAFVTALGGGFIAAEFAYYGVTQSLFGELAFVDVVAEARMALLRIAPLLLSTGLALALVAFALNRFGRSESKRAPGFVETLSVCTLAIVSFAACLPVRTPRSSEPDVLLIVLDTFRADAMNRERTPHLESMAAAGISFSDAYSTASWTLPSIASMLTGRHPREHGAGMAGEGRDASSMTAPLREDLPTLAEAFAEVGYQTVSLTTNPHLRAENGLARGFDTHRNLMLEEMTFATSFPLTKQAITATGWMQTQRARTWLALRDRDAPLFMLLHYMDAHLPRDPPEALVAREIAAGTPAGEAAVYGAMLRQLDDALGELFGALESAGRLEDTLVVITSDHGEGLGPEPERRGHGNSLLPPVTRSLLIVRSPSFREPGRICPGTRSLVDLASTIAELAELDSEIGTGRALVDRHGNCRAVPQRAFFGAISKGPLQDGLMTPDYGLIATQTEDGGARYATFDRRRDPGFREPIEERSAESAGLRASLLEHLAAQRAEATDSVSPGPAEMSDAVREQLRALGYVE